MSHLGLPSPTPDPTPPPPAEDGMSALKWQLAAALTDLMDEARAMSLFRGKKTAFELRNTIGDGALYVRMMHEGRTGGRTSIQFHADAYVWLVDSQQLLARLRLHRRLGSLAIVALLIGLIVLTASSFGTKMGTAIGMIAALPMAEFLPFFFAGLAAPFVVAFVIERQQAKVIRNHGPTLRALAWPFVVGLALAVAVLSLTAETGALPSTGNDSRMTLYLALDIHLLGLVSGLALAFVLRRRSRTLPGVFPESPRRGILWQLSGIMSRNERMLARAAWAEADRSPVAPRHRIPDAPAAAAGGAAPTPPT